MGDEAEFVTRYARVVRDGPGGLFSSGDLARIEEHAADAAAGLELLRSHAPTSLVDVGTGGGVPGLVLAGLMPELVQVHLVESSGWKARFLTEAAATLGLASRVTVHACRAEEVPATLGRETCDAGVARAVGAPAVVAEYLSPMVRVGGVLLLWTTAARAADLDDAATVEAASVLGLGAPCVVPSPSPLRSEGVLIEWPRVAPCSERVPRRTGLAGRRSLQPPRG